MERWAGKVAVVTGASAGIGAVICVRLADAGMRVVGLARREDLIDELSCNVQGQGSIYSQQCDLRDADAVAAAFDWVEENLGGVDVLVNNAAVLLNGQITDVGELQITDEQLHTILDLNIKAVMLCSRRAVSSMHKRGVSGHVISISSTLGHYVPLMELFNVYPITKHALCTFSVALLNELARLGSRIKVTTISPGLVNTAMALPGTHVLPKLEPEEVTDAVLYALSMPSNINVEELVITAVGATRP